MAKRDLPPIVDGPVTLRLLAPADLPMTRTWRNQDQIRKWFLTTDPISPEQHDAWFAQYRERDDDFVFIIEETRRLRRPIGQVSLYNLDTHDRSAEFGRLMIGDPEARGLGFGRAATDLALDVAFGPLALREVYLTVKADNVRAIDIYSACGFAETARQDDVIRMIATASARHR